MMRVDLGRFQYDADADDVYDVERDLRNAYENIVEQGFDVVESGECTNKTQDEVLSAVEPWEDTIDAVKEAAEHAGDDAMVAIFINCQRMIKEAFTIGMAVGERRSYQASAKAREAKIARRAPGLTPSERERVIIEATAAVEVRTTQVGSKYKAIAEECRKRGVSIEADAIRERSKRRVCQTPKKETST